MNKPPILRDVTVKNFKAIRDSKRLKLTPLTVLIGNNGSGKSSLIEALETFHTFVTQDLDAAFQTWHGIEHIRNKTAGEQVRFSKKTGQQRLSKAISFRITGHTGERPFKAASVINERGSGNVLFVEHEEAKVGPITALRDEERTDIHSNSEQREQATVGPLEVAESLLGRVRYLGDYVRGWQFLSLWPAPMGQPRPQRRTLGHRALAKDGSNVAEYLLDIRHRDLPAFDGIIETLKYVLPYAADVQPDITHELERTVYLQLAERNFKLPGWLLSSGTLRVLALLAVLRHPEPPPLVLIEEVENGLDPRTIHLIVEEIQATVQSGRSQVIITTHSPYLLDLLSLSSVVVCEREDGGEPVFHRPADDKELASWAKSFGPGQLYTMSRLSRRAEK
ncbi:MAG TPA: ATP-binding protein [Bacillota bacterium]|jgi:predicted ATPase|nr:ATP-binding protein [Bacillota bacterium]